MDRSKLLFSSIILVQNSIKPASSRKISKQIISTIPSKNDQRSLKAQILRSARHHGTSADLLNPNSSNRAHLIMQQRDMFYHQGGKTQRL